MEGMFAKRIRLFLILGLTLQLSGCMTLREMLGWGVEKPKATLSSVSITAMSFDSIDLQISLTIQNPNGFTIGLENLEYQVEAIGLTLGSGEYQEAFEVAGKGSGEILLPLSIQPKAVLEILKRYGDDPKELVVQVVGKGRFTTPYGGVHATFNEKKRLLKGLVPAS